MIGPRLKKGQQANLETLKQAAANGDLALVSCRWKATHKPVAILCAMQPDGDDIRPVPLAVQFDGNPYDLLEDPTE